MNDQQYIQRCLQLAAKGSGHVAPNPMVGAVLVYQGRILAEGFHQQYGQAHAEVNCFNNVAAADQHLIPASTMYVSLEPCAHFGKTPPCANRIVQEGVKKVIICNRDPFHQVSGKGMQILTENGVEVLSGISEQEGNWLNRRFFTFHQQKRPYIILKWAQTANGFFAPSDRSRLQMSDEFSSRLSHQWRREEAAILVGFTTARNDNPQLISRFGEGNQPLRIALDKDLKLPATHHLIAQDFPTWIVNQHKEESAGNLHFIKIDFTQKLIPQLLEKLYQANILSLIVEGGAHLLQSFIDEGIWDEARIFSTPPLLQAGIAAPKLTNAIPFPETELMQDSLQVHLNPNHPLPYPAELTLAL